MQKQMMQQLNNWHQLGYELATVETHIPAFALAFKGYNRPVFRRSSSGHCGLLNRTT